MDQRSKISFLYLFTLIGSIASVSIPDPFYTLLIVLLNMTVALPLVFGRKKGFLFVDIIFYTLIFVTVLMNIWALYQTFTFFNPNLLNFLKIGIYFFFAHFVTYLIIDPSKTIDLINNLIGNAKELINKVSGGDGKDASTGPKKEVLSDMNLILRTFKYKKANEEPVYLLNEKDMSFIIDEVKDGEIAIKPNDSLKDLLVKKPLDSFDVRVDMPNQVYTFLASIKSTAPYRIVIPKELEKLESRDNLRESFRLNSPKSISVALDMEGRNVDLKIRNISTTGLMFETDSKKMVEYLDGLNTYLVVRLFVDGETIELNAEIKNQTKEDLTFLYGIRYVDSSEKNEKLIQAAIFKEIDK